jgi:hypothetical protein
LAVRENRSIHIAIPAQRVTRYGGCGRQGRRTPSSQSRP